MTVGDEVVPPAVIPGPDQAYVPPPPPVKAAVVVAQVKVVELEAVGEGAVVFCVTVVVAVYVHPVAGLTTFTV